MRAYTTPFAANPTCTAEVVTPGQGSLQQLSGRADCLAETL